MNEMEHGRTSYAGRIATSLLEFSRRAAERRLIVVSGSVSTPIELPHSDWLRVSHAGRTVDLIGNGRDAAYAEGDLQPELEDLLSRRGTLVEAERTAFRLDGRISARAPNSDVFVLQCDHVRDNGTRSGAVGRLVLMVDRSHGLVLSPPR